MIIQTKNSNIQCNLYKEQRRSQNINVFRLIALDKNQNEMGHANFSIKASGDVWLHHIKTQPAFLHQGIGTALLEIMEYFAVTNYNSAYIEGIFCPENKYARKFYAENKYIIRDDEFKDFLYKFLDKQKVTESIGPLIQGEIKVEDYAVFKKAQARKIFEKEQQHKLYRIKQIVVTAQKEKSENIKQF